MTIQAFRQALREENYAANTITAYAYAVREFNARYPVLNKKNLLLHKTFLIDTYHPKTVNVRIQGLNKYLALSGRPKLKLKSVKMPKATFVDNVITREDYLFFKKKLSREPDRRWYFIVWFLAATGARISELLQLKVEHVHAGHYDICSKGGRVRRLYIPARLRNEALLWLADRSSGYLFLNSAGLPITSRGISARLKEYAVKYGIDPAVVHPHSFRHLFAKNFLRKENDLALLADLLGHENIETTRIYLQRSSREQGALVDRVVDW